jgi:chlorite dismutase
MQALEEIRKKQSDFKMQLKPINEMYALLESQNQDGQLDKDEHDKIKKLNNDWEKLVVASEHTRNKLHAGQAEFKKKLIENISIFIKDVEEFAI